MPALVAGIHVFFADPIEDVDGRDKPGHDGGERSEIKKAGISVHSAARQLMPPRSSLTPIAASNSFTISV
jgi:hypothetical protein